MDNSGIDSRDINMEIFNNFNRNMGLNMDDKIMEEFEKEFPYSKMCTESEQDYRFFEAGYKSRDKEVQRLNDLTDNMLLLITKHAIQQSEEIIEALKDGE